MPDEGGKKIAARLNAVGVGRSQGASPVACLAFCINQELT